jgi:putative flavoprotein involved in K+ transport
MTNHYDVVVIGGGQSGLVTGYYLNQQAASYTILDANKQIGGSWQHYYDSLKLFSPAKWAEMPGLPFPGDPAHHPTRYEVIDYLREYARVHNLPVQSGTRVKHVERSNGEFIIHTSDNQQYAAHAVISASGPFNTPYVPHLPGVEQFRGKTLHSFHYDRPEPYTDQHVVVVGSRDSAMQIAYELSGVARVSLAVRRELQFLPRRVLGLSLFWWLHETGYDELPLGLFTQLEGSRKIIGKEPYQTALANGNPTPRLMFTHFTENGVVWGDGTEEAADTVLYATGFKPGLGYLQSLGALDGDGLPRHRAGVSERVPGLFYVGLFGQRSHASATLRGVDRDARYIVKRVSQYLKHAVPYSPLQSEFAAGD